MPSDDEKSQNSGEDDSKKVSEEEEYVVEKIEDVRLRRGVKEYYIKWSGYDASDNTWEPEGNLTCPELIAEFNNRRKEEQAKRNERKRRPSSDTESATGNDGKVNAAGGGGVSSNATNNSSTAAKVAKKDRKKRGESAMNGFDRNYKVEEIVGASETCGELSFLIKWKDAVEPEIIPASICNEKCPMEVIKFYQARLIWEEPPIGNSVGNNSAAVAEKSAIADGLIDDAVAEKNAAISAD